jgi:hypothetical protein
MSKNNHSILRSSLVITTLIATGWTTIQAAPLGRIILEARRQGETSWQRNFLGAALGDVFEYRILAHLAPVGATNVQGPAVLTITSTANSGFQSLSLQIRQDSSAPIQVSFDPPLASPVPLASLRNGWADGTGVSAGMPTPRPGGNGNDLVGIRPVQSPGMFFGADPHVVLSGSTFRVTRSPASSFAVLTPSWGTVSGALRINGSSQVFITPEGQNGADPVIAFDSLVLGIPEPATIVLAALGIAALFSVARRSGVRARSKAVGGTASATCPG